MGGVVSTVGDVVGGVVGGAGDLVGGIVGGAGNIIGNVLTGPKGPSSLPYVPKPDVYNPTSLLDSSLNLPTNLQINADKTALNSLRGIALGDQISPWAQTSLNRMQGMKDRMSTQVAQRNASNAQAAQNQLAATSGLGAVSSALLADRAKTENMLDQQRLRREQKQASSNVKSEDAKIRQSLLEGLPQAELAMGGVEQQNILNRLSEKRRLDQLDKRRFQAEMGNFAQEQTAKAISDSGSKGLLGDIFGGIFG